MTSCACVLSSEGSNGASGTLILSQASEEAPTKIEGSIRGLTPRQKHGITVCVWGDLSQGGVSCGPIFNPFGACVRLEGAPASKDLL
jgi:superoxide dismutase, Cu-Zn family